MPHLRLTLPRFASLTSLAWIALGTATFIARPALAGYAFDNEEAAYQAQILATPISLEGRIVDELGMPIGGAQLRLIGWGESITNDGEATTSWGDGHFTLANLERRNVMLEISADGYYTEVLPVELQIELGSASVELGDLELVAQQFGRARLSFAGDVMFDRRMFDDGVLSLDNLAADTQALFRYVEPWLQADDHTAINLETPVTNVRSTPHPSKSYVFAAYSESAEQLPLVGVDSVNLGNNHIYDYLEDGVSDTLFHLDAIGLPYYGAGMSPTEAMAAIHRPDINGVELSLQGFSNFIGYSYGGVEYQVVTRNDPLKGGALPSFNSCLDAFVDGEAAAGRFPIPVIHGGIEYQWTQSEGMHNDFERAVQHGAGLVVAHHPHVAHGVSVINAGDGPVFVFGSLGNFVFDQTLKDTFRSYIAIVDVVEGMAGPKVERIQLAPIRLDGYAPRPLVGAHLEQFGRHLAHLSTAEAPVSGFDSAAIFAENGRLVVLADESEAMTTDLLDKRNLQVTGGTTGLVSLDPFTGTDALASLTSDVPATCELGRDLLGLGDFEDPDVDDSYFEAEHWELSTSRYVQNSVTHSGTGAAVLLRKSSYSSRTSLWFDTEVSVVAGRDMTISGYIKGDNAGQFRVTVRWIDDSGSTISHTTGYQNFAADYDWQRFTIDATAPAGAVGLMVYFRHYPPSGTGEGRVFLDDVTFVEWDSSAIATDAQGTSLATPNAWDAVRCTAADGPMQLDLVHRTYESQ